MIRIYYINPFVVTLTACQWAYKYSPAWVLFWKWLLYCFNNFDVRVGCCLVNLIYFFMRDLYDIYILWTRIWRYPIKSFFAIWTAVSCVLLILLAFISLFAIVWLYVSGIYIYIYENPGLVCAPVVFSPHSALWLVVCAVLLSSQALLADIARTSCILLFDLNAFTLFLHVWLAIIIWCSLF